MRRVLPRRAVRRKATMSRSRIEVMRGGMNDAASPYRRGLMVVLRRRSATFDCAAPHRPGGDTDPLPQRGPDAASTILPRGRMSHPPPDPKRNHLLAALPTRSGTLAARRPDAGAGHLRIGWQSERRLLYGVRHRVVAVRHGGRASAEIAVVGNKGLIGISLFMGSESTPSRAVV